jgi:hypothetical protein
MELLMNYDCPVCRHNTMEMVDTESFSMQVCGTPCVHCRAKAAKAEARKKAREERRRTNPGFWDRLSWLLFGNPKLNSMAMKVQEPSVEVPKLVVDPKRPGQRSRQAVFEERRRGVKERQDTGVSVGFVGTLVNAGKTWPELTKCRKNEYVIDLMMDHSMLVDASAMLPPLSNPLPMPTVKEPKRDAWVK